jgi:hypothetical protein
MQTSIERKIGNEYEFSEKNHLQNNNENDSSHSNISTLRESTKAKHKRQHVGGI